VLDGPIQRGTISAGLAAADNLESFAVHASPTLADKDDRIHSGGGPRLHQRDGTVKFCAAPACISSAEYALAHLAPERY
jgi:hypothetical protein